MGALRVLAFDGVVPRLSPTLLGNSLAQVAENTKLYSKELRYWRGPSLAHASALDHPLTIFRMYNSAGASVWLMWDGDVDVAVGPVADSTETRVYYTGDGPPKKTNYAMATSGAEPYPTTFQTLGVPKPTSAPTATITVAGTGTAETRAYVYTQVNTFGLVKEESAPSDPVSVTTGEAGSTITIGGFAAAPTTGYNITHRRIYRTVVGDTTVSYEFVAEIAVGTASYADSLTALQLGPNLTTIGWIAPPTALSGIVAMPGGSLAGFVGNTVYFSEPYYPHAWPLAYALSLPANIVGLAVIATTLVVMTDTTSFFIYGGTPGQMQVERIQLPEPCLGKATIVTDEDGVIYASPNGLVGLSADTRGVLTRTLFTAEEWQALVPGTMHAAVVQGRYIGVFPNEVPPRAMVLTRNDEPALTFLGLPASAMHVDAKNAELYYVDAVDGNIYQMDTDETKPLNYEWKSKRWQLSASETYGVMRVDAEYSQLADASTYNSQVADIAAYNAAAFVLPLMDALNTTPLNVFEVNGSTMLNQPTEAAARSVQVVITGDGETVANLTVTSLDPIRLPPFKVREIEFSILGNINVRSITMATTMDELKAVG